MKVGGQGTQSRAKYDGLGVNLCFFSVPKNHSSDCYPKECSKRSGNLINRKNTIFYIETIPNFFSQLQKNIFFSTDQKKYFFRKKYLRNFIIRGNSSKEPPLRVDLVVNEGGVLWVLGQKFSKFSPPAVRFALRNRHLGGPKCQNFQPAAGFLFTKASI